MKLVAGVVLLFLCCAFAARPNNSYKNRRIIKVRVPLRQHPDFYKGPKGYLRPSYSPIRFKGFSYKHREYPRPNHQATYYSVSNIYSSHHARPPPQATPNYSFYGGSFGNGYSKEIYQKYPPFTYGSSYPHKKPLSTFKFPSIKDEIHVTHSQTVSPSPAPAHSSSSSQSPSSSQSSSSSHSSSFSQSSSSSSYHQPTSFYVSSPHAHVQSFEDNREPIKEIPAPNLGSKPTDADEHSTYGKGQSVDVDNEYEAYGKGQGIHNDNHYETYGKGQGIHNDNHYETYGKGQGIHNDNHYETYGKGQGIHNDNEYETYGKGQGIDNDNHYETYGKGQGIHNDNHYETYGKGQSIDFSNQFGTYGKGPSIDVTNLLVDSGEQQLTFPANEYYSTFGHTQNFDVLNDNYLPATSVYSSTLYKDAAKPTLQTSSHESGQQSVVASTPSPEISFKNNKIAVTPLPSPSPGYEVTEDQHAANGATPANDQQYYYAPDPDPSSPVHKVPPTKEVLTVDKNIYETYIPQQNFQILEGGTVAAPITTLSTQELFHLMQGFPRQVPIVAEPPVVTILGHHEPGTLYLQPTYAYAQTGNGQYSGQTVASGQTAQQYVIAQQGSYVPQENYETIYSQSSDLQKQNSHDYQYEQEALESQESGSRTVAETDAENSAGKDGGQRANQIILHFNKLPEVPFYTTLPNKEAAEALAGLQAAGSIGSNYVGSAAQEEKEYNTLENNVYTPLRGDQGPESEGDGETEASQFGLTHQQLVTPQKVEVEQTRVGTLSDVEIQKSVPVFETSYPASSLLDDSNASRTAGGDSSKGSFGKRIRPK